MSARQAVTSRTQVERNAAAKKNICKAALELFAENGYESTTQTMIGQRAGFSRSIVFYHFGSKTALAEYLLDDMGRRATFLQDLDLTPGDSGPTAWTSLQQHLQDSWQNFCQIRAYESQSLIRGEMVLCATAIFSNDQTLNQKVSKMTGTLIERVATALRCCIRDGILRPDVDAGASAAFYVFSIWGLVNALFTDISQRLPAEHLIEPLKAYLDSLRNSE